MDQRIKAKWLEALRSGRYEQGQNVLRDAGGRYCCLGVLCDIAVQEGVARQIDPTGPNYSTYAYTTSDQDLDLQGGVLPLGVSTWAELNSGNPVITIERDGGEDIRSLSSLNDAGASFHQIAEYIERYL